MKPVPFICCKCGEFIERRNYKKGYRRIFKEHLEDKHSY